MAVKNFNWTEQGFLEFHIVKGELAHNVRCVLAEIQLVKIGVWNDLLQCLVGISCVLYYIFFKNVEQKSVRIYYYIMKPLSRRMSW